MSITVSAVIPAYNAGKYIARAIDSVLAQTRPADEVIVVDDGSTDDTAKIAQAYGNRISFIRQENAGASVARNTGIEAAKSEWIAFLDADDEWLPDKLKLQTEHLHRNPNLVWTTGNYVRCHCQGGRRHDDLAGQRLSSAKELMDGREYFDSYFQAYRAFAKGHTITMMIKRDVLIAAGLFLPGQLRINDYDMWLRIAYIGHKFGFLSETMAIAHRDIPESIVKVYREPAIISDFIDHHLKLACEYDFLEEFKPCAAQMLGWWIHSFIVDKRGKEARSLLRQFGDLYSKYFRTTVFMESLFPRTGLLYHNLKKKLSGSLKKSGSVSSG